MFNFITKIFVFVALLLSFNQVTAKQVSGLYGVEILVTSESANVRWGAFKRGMDEIFVRISGDSVIMDKLKRPSAKLYVKQYSYEPVPVTANSAPVSNSAGVALTHKMKIQYNGSAMEKYLLDKGFSVWGKHRPDVVVWLAVRDGVNEYVLKQSDKSLLKTAADDALVRRGVPVRWPLFDYKDKKRIGVADIRGGFKEQVLNASKRYSRGPAMTGSMIWDGKRWQSSWSLLMAGGNRYWSLSDTNYSRLIKKSIDQAADALGVVFAVNNKMNAQQLATIKLDIKAVNSITKYHHIENYLTSLSAVEKTMLLKVDGNSAVFEITLRSDKEDLLDLIENGAELIKIEGQKPLLAGDTLSPALIPEPDIEKNIKKLAVDGVTPEEKAFIPKKYAVVPLVVNKPAPIPVYYYRLGK